MAYQRNFQECCIGDIVKGDFTKCVDTISVRNQATIQPMPAQGSWPSRCRVLRFRHHEEGMIRYA